MSRHRQRRPHSRISVLLAVLALSTVGAVLVEAPQAEAAATTWVRGTDGSCSGPLPVVDGATLTMSQATFLCVRQSPRGVARVDFSIDGQPVTTKRWVPYSLRRGAASGLTTGAHTVS